jgi:hypothetical protein
MRDEASTGEPAGQPLSRESFKLVQGADAVSAAESNTDRRDSASTCSALRGLRTWHVGTLFAWEPGELLLGALQKWWGGPHREAEESKPMKYGPEKSDLFIVAMKPGEQAWATGCGTGGAKGEDQEEHGRATHVPDSEPGERVPEA